MGATSERGLLGVRVLPFNVVAVAAAAAAAAVEEEEEEGEPIGCIVGMTSFFGVTSWNREGLSVAEAAAAVEAGVIVAALSAGERTGKRARG